MVKGREIIKIRCLCATGQGCGSKEIEVRSFHE